MNLFNRLTSICCHLYSRSIYICCNSHVPAIHIVLGCTFSMLSNADGCCSNCNVEIQMLTLCHIQCRPLHKAWSSCSIKLKAILDHIFTQRIYYTVRNIVLLLQPNFILISSSWQYKQMLPYPKQCSMPWGCGYLPVNGECFQAFQLFSFLMSGSQRTTEAWEAREHISCTHSYSWTCVPFFWIAL